MLSSVRAATAQGATITLPLDEVTNGIAVKEIEGLDPVKASIVTTSFAKLDGTQFQNARREGRDIILHLGLEPDYSLESVQDVRKRLYKYFMPKRPVDLLFTDSDGLEVTISGRVESCEAPLFVNEPAMDVVIRCFDSDFVDPEIKSQSNATVDNTTEWSFTYNGSVEAGITFVLLLNRSLTEFTIYADSDDGIMQRLDFAAPLLDDDILTIRTVERQKRITLTRAGVDSSLLYAMTPQSSWIELQPGVNTFRVFAEGAAIPYTIYYFEEYGGL